MRKIRRAVELIRQGQGRIVLRAACSPFVRVLRHRHDRIDLTGYQAHGYQAKIPLVMAFAQETEMEKLLAEWDKHVK